MKDFRVIITETYQKTVIVAAENEDQARTRVRDAWQNTEYIVDQESFSGVEFYVAGESEGVEADKRMPHIEGKDVVDILNDDRNGETDQHE